MRFHLVGLPHTQITDDFSACAFTEKIRKFAIMMTGLGHEVILYAGDQNTAPVKEFVSCFTEEDRLKALAGAHFSDVKWDAKLPFWKKFNATVGLEIMKRQQPRDFVCIMGGRAQEPLNRFLSDESMVVEFGIGHGGSFSKWRIWESYAWMHTCYGTEQPNRDPNAVRGQWFDAVIPGYFEVERFDYREEKDDYYLFVGRLNENKGIQIASDICKKAGVKLLIAGAGKPPEYGSYMGVVNPVERNQLMSRAKALIMPTIYVEPFGNVAVEAMACGTPVICTDWGAMTETVIDGVTGIRCRTEQEFIDALKGVELLQPQICRAHAVHNYSLEATAPKYDKHFRRLLQVWDNGWNAKGAAK